MSAQVSPEEVQAILDSVHERPRAPAEVVSRDFRQPKRLSPAQLESLRRTIQEAEPDIESSLRIWLRSPHKVDVVDVNEIHSLELLKSFAPPLCVLCFECAGQPSWAVWDVSTCVSATEIALGATQVTEPSPRQLTGVEQGILKNILGRIVALASGTLGVEPKSLRLVQDLETLEKIHIDQRSADPQRLSIQIAIQGAVGSSTLRLYLAGVDPPEVAGAAPPPEVKKRALPTHLDEVQVEIGAQLGSADVPLSQLLNLEVGDVIPLGVDAGSLLDVHVEGECCAAARWGDHKGRMAIRIQALGARVDAEHG